tara:strand:- start:1916 stop:2851 length:936 start_codon:yes stop_codon:yes gene_type:complete
MTQLATTETPPPAPIVEGSMHLADVLEARANLTPQDRIKQNEELVRILAPEVQREHLMRVQGKDYMCVGGGIAIANGMGFSISCSEVTFNKDLGVYSAIATMTDGVITAEAIGYVGDDERKWTGGPKFALMSMTQTRAIAKLCRANFGHLYTLLGAASATPAEEMSAVPMVHASSESSPSQGGGGKSSPAPLQVEKKQPVAVPGSSGSAITKIEIGVEVPKRAGGTMKKNFITLADSTVVECFSNKKTDEIFNTIGEKDAAGLQVELVYDTKTFGKKTVHDFKDYKLYDADARIDGAPPADDVIDAGDIPF